MASPASSGLPRGIDRRPSQHGTMYRARVYWRGRQWSLGSFFTLGDARAALAIARSDLARGIFVPPTLVRAQRADAEVAERAAQVTVAEWAEDWLARLADAGRSPATLTSYRSTLRVHVLPTLGERPIVGVTRDEVDELVDAVRTRRGPVDNVVRTLRALFLAAVAAGRIPESPVKVTLAKKAAHDDEPLDDAQVATPTEVQRLAAAMPAELRLAVLLAAWCALRLGEVLGLQRRDVEGLDDPATAVVHVRRQWASKTSPPAYTPPKRGSRRDLAIPASLVPLIVAHIEEHVARDAEAPLFPSSRDRRRPVAHTSFDRAWRDARAEVRPGFRFHDLRHTGLTAYARQGATLRELQARGGHRDVAAALRYQHATAERDRALTSRLDGDLTE